MENYDFPSFKHGFIGFLHISAVFSTSVEGPYSRVCLQRFGRLHQLRHRKAAVETDALYAVRQNVSESGWVW